MFSVFKWKQTTPAIIALDIGTEFIKALVVDISENKANILGIGKVRQNLHDIQSGAILDIASVVQNCQEAIAEAEDNAKMKGTELIMGVAGELIKGTTVSLNYKRENPEEKINIDELKNIVHKVQWKAFDQVRTQISHETGHSEIDMKLVNAAIVDVRIDGYKVSSPLGFHGKEVKISVFNSFAPLIHFGALETIAAELEDLHLITILSEPYAISQALRAKKDEDPSAIYLDIGGSTSDIAIVRDGSLEGTSMFAIGGRTFTKRIARELNVSFLEAEKIKLIYSSEKLKKDDHEKIKKILKPDIDMWISAVEIALGDFQLNSMPTRIYLCGAGANLPEIKQSLSDHPWMRHLPFSKPPTIHFASIKNIRSVTNETKKELNHEYVTPISLASAALEFGGEESPLTTMLKRVIGIIKM